MNKRSTALTLAKVAGYHADNAGSICLDQRLGQKCICFSCEAKRIVAKATGGQP